MTDNKKNYKVVCPELNLVLFVRGLSLEQEKALYETIKQRINSAEKPIDTETYKEFICRKLLIDGDAFVDSFQDKDGDEEVLTAIYSSIVELYPPFALDFVCSDLNAQTFFSDESNEVLKHLRAVVKQKMGGVEFEEDVSLSSIEDIEALENHLKENIIGQRDAIKSLIKSVKMMAAGLAGHASFLFVGPTGVGKTEIAKLLGDKFSGNFMKVNCAEYAHAHEYAKLIGSPPGYIGHTEKSLLAEKSEKSNRWVFLFDEIEKAHHKFYDFLLSLLDDGTCTDNMGTVLDFSQSIFIFTSNQGLTEVKRDPVGFGKKDEVDEKVTSEVIRKSIKRHFSPEFLNRIDDLVLFQALTKDEVRKIAELQLDGLPIQVTKPLVDYIVDHGYSHEYGARNIQRFIKNNIADKVADCILHRMIPKKEGGYYTPRITKEGVKIVNTKSFEVSA
jgi:ATP-dependent Clp protease ATP-binding subunit ClpA